MAEIKIKGDISGSTTIKAPDSGSDEVIELSSALASKLNATAGNILQIVQGTSSTQVDTTSTTFVTSGVSASITPTSTSNKILVFAMTTGRTNNSTYEGYITIFRGTTSDTNLGNGNNGFGLFYTDGGKIWVPTSAMYLDSPNTTSSQTYTLAIRSGNASTTVSAQYATATGVIILMEVAG